MKFIKELLILKNECLRGKTLGRTLHNIYLSELPSFSGRGIDYGAKNARGSYYRFLDVRNAEIKFCDLYAQDRTKVKIIDFEKDFDLSSEAFDFALVMNTLEHIYNYQNFMVNVSRSLKKGGRLEGCVPFLYPFHKDPDDFFRYTDAALRKILKKANFEDLLIKKICTGRLLLSASLFSNTLKFRPLILLWWFISYLITKTLGKMNDQNSDMYAFITFSAKKR